jgi:hypothetical protein
MPVASKQTTKQLGTDGQGAQSNGNNTSTQSSQSTRSTSEGARTTKARSVKKPTVGIQVEEAAEQVSTQEQHASITIQFTVKLTGGIGTVRL